MFVIIMFYIFFGVVEIIQLMVVDIYDIIDINEQFNWLLLGLERFVFLSLRSGLGSNCLCSNRLKTVTCLRSFVDQLMERPFGIFFGGEIRRRSQGFTIRDIVWDVVQLHPKQS